MRYKYLTIVLMLATLFSQGNISLESVLDGTFRTESIGRYDWKNSSDSYYFSERSDEGLEFYEYNLASNDTLKAFTVKKNIISNLHKAKMITISPLEMVVKNYKNQIKKHIAINEVSILRQSRQAASLSIYHGSKQVIKKLVSDGVLVSTPAGSTAYNLSVHGPILSLNSKRLSISPISPFRPRRWKGKIVSDKSKINIRNLNSKKRPISAVADNIEVRNAKNIIVKTNQKLKFNLLYDRNRSLQKKIKIEQLRKETS